MFRSSHCLHTLLPDLKVTDIVLRNSGTSFNLPHCSYKLYSHLSTDVSFATAIDMFCSVGHIWSDLMYHFYPHNWMAFVRLNKRHVMLYVMFDLRALTGSNSRTYVGAVVHFLLSAYVIVVLVAAREPAGVGHVRLFIYMTQIWTSDACASGCLADLSVVQRLTSIGLSSSVFPYAGTLTQQAASLSSAASIFVHCRRWSSTICWSRPAIVLSMSWRYVWHGMTVTLSPFADYAPTGSRSLSEPDRVESMIHSVPTTAVSLSSPLPDFTCRLLTSAFNRLRSSSSLLALPATLWRFSLLSFIAPWLFRRNLRLLQRTRWSSWSFVDARRASGACRRRQYTSRTNRRLEHNRVQLFAGELRLGTAGSGRHPRRGRNSWCRVHPQWSAIADRRHSVRRPVLSPSVAMVVSPMSSGAGLYDVRSQVLEIIRSRHVPGRPADVRLVRRSVLQWHEQRLTRIALRLDHHRATRPTGSYAVCDLSSTPVVLVVRRWMSRCEAEGPASGESRSPRGSTSSLHVADCCRVARWTSCVLQLTTAKTTHVLDRTRQRRSVTPVSSVAVLDELLGRGRPRPPDIDATDIHRYLDDKVIRVRTATSGADPPSFTFCPTGCTLQDFYPVTPADVEALVRSFVQ